MRGVTAVLVFLLLASTLRAEPLRIATFNTELSRKGPGLLLRDLRRDNAQVAAVVDTIRRAEADILAVQSLDWDHDQETLRAFQALLSEAGMTYPHAFALKPNAGIASGLDLDGDQRLGEPEDAWGWGRFTGQSGIALLSRYPILADRARNFTDLLWQDLPDHRMPRTQDGDPFPDADVAAQLRLSSTNHWIVPVRLPDGTLLRVMSFHAAPPVFDGPEDRNGRRNADEILLWLHLLDGALGPAPAPPFVLLGDANNDPHRGEGHKDAITRLLRDPRLQDPLPKDANAASHTVTWESTGPMRVDYVLPSAGLQVTASGILRSDGSRHGLVWVDIRR
ncbi:endonuclease/exonuclease/phosphatase family protein [Epibacterium sp. MM17-32]|uniref:endonuclease/exonuclease/phosphatase family protein n=1 Tax=Epibacterium sp. MM17-32 TaxID=2917734 RepID=UPI001EF690A7|nr:endonuclease/exonuclease/phosphatase family protein [Epibacterium sp. MM17-32]MCG7628622.1 endonuclease/exonuclease/phosphatase family protein [Epibacterium sp. MM17-32]